MQQLSRTFIVASLAIASLAVIPTGAAAATSDRSGFGAISAEAVNAEPTADDLAADGGPAVLRAQILLDRANFSPGVLSGRTSSNMRHALFFFQQEHGLPATGDLDAATYDALVARGGRDDAVVRITLSARDVRGPYRWIPVGVYDQAEFECLCYASALEMLNERYHTITAVLTKLNPSIYFGDLAPGMELWVPNVTPFNVREPYREGRTRAIAKIIVNKRGRYLQALASDGSIVFHFPTTVGSVADPSPNGTYSVAAIQWRPVFRYSPGLYSDVPDWRQNAKLPPGPNSPVGIVWIATSRDHVGIHGTPLPHTIGLASSHGCVRLTNWNAAQLASAVRPGVPIAFVSRG